MPRVKRDAAVPTYELTADEQAFERRLWEAERNLVTKIETIMQQPRLNSRDLGFMAGALAKLRSETRARFKLVGRLSLSAKEASTDPEAARATARAYLASLPLLDRLSIYEGVYADATVVAWLAGMDDVRLKRIYHEVRGVRAGDLSIPIMQPLQAPITVWQVPQAQLEAAAENAVAPALPEATGAETP